MPKPRPKIEICLGSSCFARGNDKNLAVIERYLMERGLRDEVDVELGCSLCQNHCSEGPNIAIDGVPHRGVDTRITLDLLKAKFEKGGG